MPASPRRRRGRDQGFLPTRTGRRPRESGTRQQSDREASNRHDQHRARHRRRTHRPGWAVHRLAVRPPNSRRRGTGRPSAARSTPRCSSPPTRSAPSNGSTASASRRRSAPPARSASRAPSTPWPTGSCTACGAGCRRATAGAGSRSPDRAEDTWSDDTWREQGERNDVGIVLPPDRAPLVLAVYTDPDDPDSTAGNATIADATAIAVRRLVGQ